MDYSLLLQLKDRANKVKTELPPEMAASFDDSFNVEYAHNSTAIEGNTLTLIQKRLLLRTGCLWEGKRSAKYTRLQTTQRHSLMCKNALRIKSRLMKIR